MIKLMFISFQTVILAVCDPYFPENDARWYIKNDTDHAIKIANGNQADGVINAGDSAKINSVTLQYAPYFECLFSIWDKSPEQIRYIDVLSVDDELLKTWRYSEKSEPGKQFFKSSSWHLYEFRESLGYEEVDSKWVFEISQEDIDNH